MNGFHLVKSLDPFQDRNIAERGAAIVIFHNEHEIRILTYYEPDECWYITAHQSVECASGEQIPGADFYYNGVGYVNEAWLGLKQIELSESLDNWHKAYDDVIPCDLQDETAANEFFSGR